MRAMRGNAPDMGDFNGMGLTALRRDTFERSTRDARQDIYRKRRMGRLLSYALTDMELATILDSLWLAVQTKEQFRGEGRECGLLAATYLDLKAQHGRQRRNTVESVSGTSDKSGHATDGSGWRGRQLRRYRQLEGLSRTGAAWKCGMGEARWARLEEEQTYPTPSDRKQILACAGYPERFFALPEDEWQLAKRLFVTGLAKPNPLDGKEERE